MPVHFYEKEKLFQLDTEHTTYAIGIVDEEKFLGHIYYGGRIKDNRLGYLLRIHEAPFVPSENNRDRVSFLDSFPMEYPCHGLGDYRESCIAIRTEDYRLASCRENHYYDCWGVVSRDKTEALFTYIQVLNRPNYHSRRIYLQGLAPEKIYRIEGEDGSYSGEALMKAGYNVQNLWGDFRGRLIHFMEV